MVSINQVAINASPLIVLFKSNQADLLPQLFDEIVVPQAVWQEVTSSGTQDAAAQQLPNVTWVKRVEVAITPSIAAWDLGVGESSVLSFALENPAYRAMVDDRAARRCAKALSINTLGTGGAIVLAKRRGLITSTGEGLKKLQDAGLWLSTDLINLLKQQAGE
jgi:predicted nucleic acid-binding protein